MSLSLKSTAFNPGGIIPEEYSYRAGNRSPALSWEGVPVNTRTFAITCLDPDSNYGVFTHWVIFNISGATRQLPANVPALAILPDGAKQAKSDHGQYGYTGPNPPKGQKHRYVFKIYALDVYLEQFSADMPSKELIRFFSDHTIEQAEYFGYYQGQ
jgi:Raf kinase inhibitor-like YbhB/YbcL family protein